MRQLPAPVTAYLNAVTQRVVGVLGDDLLGVYTTGSLALGDYRPARSDIDLAAVARGAPDVRLRTTLARLLDHTALPCPAAGLEFVLYPDTALATSTSAPAYLLNVNTGPAIPSLVSVDPGEGSGFWYAIDRDITRQCGTALRGPAPQLLFARAPFEELLQVVIASVRAHRDAADDHLPDNAVLNGCRARCFGDHHRWYAKRAAARQVVSQGGRFVPLVRQAVASFEAGRRVSDALPAVEVRAFLTDVVERLVRTSTVERA